MLNKLECQIIVYGFSIASHQKLHKIRLKQFLNLLYLCAMFNQITFKQFGFYHVHMIIFIFVLLNEDKA